MAAALHVDVTAVYAWERGTYEPSAETITRLYRLGAGEDWKYSRYFLLRLGLTERDLQDIAERIGPPPPHAIIVRSVDGREELLFPRSLFPSQESLCFIRLRPDDLSYFGPGDIVLVDRSKTRIAALEDGCFVAVAGKADQFRAVGRLQKLEAQQGVFHVLLQLSLDANSSSLPVRGDRSLFLGSIVSGTDEIMEAFQVLGKAVGWLSRGQFST